MTYGKLKTKANKIGYNLVKRKKDEHKERIDERL